MKAILRLVFILFFIASELSVINAVALNKTRFFNGLLSDFLRINLEFGENLTVSPRCKAELDSIQNGLNAREVWTMKCESVRYATIKIGQHSVRRVA